MKMTYTAVWARVVVSALLLLIWALTGACASKPAYRTAQVAWIGVNAADYHSTRRALESGAGREGNPLIPENPWGLLAVKAASTITVLLLADELADRQKRTVATVLLTAASVAIGIIAAHNYQIGGRR